MTENFNTEEQAQEVDKFFKEHQFKGTEPSVEQALESIRIQVEWLQRDKEILAKFLSSY
jgi:aminopeptidase N